jgi:hypothetical protein
MVLFDHGERRSGVPAQLERLGIDLQGARLPAGDYVVSDRLVVERKGATDLAASIKDRRLFEQLGRLAGRVTRRAAGGFHSTTPSAWREPRRPVDQRDAAYAQGAGSASAETPSSRAR